jgi:hypothetical protein
LVEVKPLGPRTAGAGEDQSKLESREPFSVLFRGRHEPSLSQGIVRVANETMGVFDEIFVVPVAEDEHGRYYEALFN